MSDYDKFIETLDRYNSAVGIAEIWADYQMAYDYFQAEDWLMSGYYSG